MTGAPEWNMKACLSCGKVKPFHEFSPDKIGRGGRHSYCKECRKVKRQLTLMKSETSGIVTPAVELLNKMPGVWAVRVNAGGRKAGRSFIHLAPKGTADIFAVANGQAFFFEAKKPGEKQTPEQKAFSIRIVDCGAKYFVITAARQAAEEIAIWRQR